jgi:transposase InsO family protein
MASRSSSRALCASCRLNSSLWCCKHRLRDELLNGEIFYTLREAQIVIESWRRHYNTIRPHASIGYKPSAPEVFVPTFAAWPAALRRPAPPATLAQPTFLVTPSRARVGL